MCRGGEGREGEKEGRGMRGEIGEEEGSRAGLRL